MENGTSDLYNLFKERAEAVSTRVIRVSGHEGAAAALTQIIREEKVAKIVADPTGMVINCVERMEEESPLKVVRGQAVSDPGNGVSLYFGDLRRHAEDADMGLSEMFAGVAETGSLAGDCTSMGNRLVSTLPPVHVALVPARNIVATPGEAIKMICAGGRPPGYLSFITGPSRTADIERVLTIGVHGPAKLYVILVDETGGGSE
ncbi:MAG: LutC/YkgG family protein [Bacillota bacterium]